MKILKEPLGAKNIVEQHFVLHMLYETEFGMFNHADPTLSKEDPLAVVRAKPEESLMALSPLWDVATRYARYKIKERYGITFHEYLELPVTTSFLYNQMATEIFGEIELEEIKARNRVTEAELGKITGK